MSASHPRFCVIAAVPSANCGIAKTKHANIEPHAQPYPKSGLMFLLSASSGLFIESVMYAIAPSIAIPKIIASGWSHMNPKPPSTPKYNADASDPPPSVIALCSHPGPENFVYVFNTAHFPRLLASRIAALCCSMFFINFFRRKSAP